MVFTYVQVYVYVKILAFTVKEHVCLALHFIVEIIHCQSRALLIIALFPLLHRNVINIV